jgi:excinuclease UvrABC nuclease subunit
MATAAQEQQYERAAKYRDLISTVEQLMKSRESHQRREMTLMSSATTTKTHVSCKPLPHARR